MGINIGLFVEIKIKIAPCVERASQDGLLSGSLELLPVVFTSSGGKDAARNWLQRENIYCIGSNKLNLILHHKGSNGFDLGNTSVL